MYANRTSESLPVGTPEAFSPHRGRRGVGAVFGGLVATFVITTATDIVLHSLKVFPPLGERMADSLFLLALAYRVPFNTLGAYITARLAPARPMRHALALGITGVVLATIGAAVMGKHGPAWYSVANIVIALPCAWLGGRLSHSRVASRAAFINR